MIATFLLTAWAAASAPSPANAVIAPDLLSGHERPWVAAKPAKDNKKGKKGKKHGPQEPEQPAEAAPPPVSAPAPAAPPPASAPAPAAPPPAAAPAAAPPPPAGAAAPAAPAAAVGQPAIEEIKATSVGEPAPAPGVTDASPQAPSRAAAKELLRLGAFATLVLPRAGMKVGPGVGLTAELPLGVVGLPGHFDGGGMGIDLMGNLSFGWTPMRNQEVKMLTGTGPAGLPRGNADVIDRTLVLPVDLGVTARFDLGWAVRPYAGVGLAMDIVRREFEVFGVTYAENDFSLGLAVRLGGYLPLGPGGVVAEVVYREISSDIANFDGIASANLATFNVQAGYLLSL